MNYRRRRQSSLQVRSPGYQAGLPLRLGCPLLPAIFPIHLPVLYNPHPLWEPHLTKIGKYCPRASPLGSCPASLRTAGRNGAFLPLHVVLLPKHSLPRIETCLLTPTPALLCPGSTAEPICSPGHPILKLEGEVLIGASLFSEPHTWPFLPGHSSQTPCYPYEPLPSAVQF